MKNNRNGKASLLSEAEYSKIQKQIRIQKYKLLLHLAWYTGERWGALVQMQTEDVYGDNGLPLEYITFRACTRKASPDGKRETRQIPVHPVLAEVLRAYKPDSLWLFPNREGDGPMSLRWADKILRSAVEKAGLDALGISTHSTRRSFINKLHTNGVDIYTIQAITGHRDLKSLGHYIEISTDKVKGAIATL